MQTLSARIHDALVSDPDLLHFVDLLAECDGDAESRDSCRLIDNIVLCSTSLDEHAFLATDKTIEQKQRENRNYTLPLVWVRIGYWFAQPRDARTSSKLSEAILWLIQNTPYCRSMVEPYCYDLIDEHYEVLAKQWQKSLNSYISRARWTCQNASEFFRERNPVLAGELDNLSMHLERQAGESGEIGGEDTP